MSPNELSYLVVVVFGLCVRRLRLGFPSVLSALVCACTDGLDCGDGAFGLGLVDVGLISFSVPSRSGLTSRGYFGTWNDGTEGST